MFILHRWQPANRWRSAQKCLFARNFMWLGPTTYVWYSGLGECSSWVLLLGVWYLKARSDMRPPSDKVWKHMRALETFSKRNKSPPSSPRKALMPWRSVTLFWGVDNSFLFFSRQWSKANVTTEKICRQQYTVSFHSSGPKASPIYRYNYYTNTTITQIQRGTIKNESSRKGHTRSQ